MLSVALKTDAAMTVVVTVSPTALSIEEQEIWQQ